MSLQNRFHITFRNQKTTISVDNILSELLSVKLGFVPETSESKKAVRDWIQIKLIKELGDQPIRKSASQYARRYLIEAIADAELEEKRVNWLLRNDN